jgi:hypothetical protein
MAQARASRACGMEQADVALLAPGGELAQVQRVGLAGQAVVASQETSQRQPFGLVNTGSATAITVDGDEVVVVIGHLPGLAETRKAGPAKAPAVDEDPTLSRQR